MRMLFVSMNMLTPMIRRFDYSVGMLSAYLKPLGHQIAVVEVNSERDLKKKIGPAIDAFKPDIVGMNGCANQGPYFPEITAISRRHAPNALVVAGGWHASIAPEHTLRNAGVDFVLSGEGEIALAAWLEDLEKGGNGRSIQNFCYLDDEGQFVHNPGGAFIADLDTLPMADYSCMDIEGILDVNLRTPVLVAGRGCPFSCTFCSNASLRATGRGKYTRMRSPEKVIEDIRYLKNNHGARHFFFRDDTFTWDMEWTMAMCDAMSKEDITFECLTRVDCLDQPVVEALAHGGCVCCWVGIDAGNEEIRENILQKHTTVDQIVEACDRLWAVGITPMATNMLGLPFETPEKHMITVEINQRIYRDHIAIAPGAGSGPKIFVFGPFPGTPLDDVCREQGWLPTYPKNYNIYFDSFLNMPQFTHRQIMLAFNDFRYRVYRPNFPVIAWIYRIWDWLVGPILRRSPWTRQFLTQGFGVATKLFKMAEKVSPHRPEINGNRQPT